jgi:hypothetical protein
MTVLLFFKFIHIFIYYFLHLRIYFLNNLSLCLSQAVWFAVNQASAVRRFRN